MGAPLNTDVVSARDTRWRQGSNHIWWLLASGLISGPAAASYIMDLRNRLFPGDDDPSGGAATGDLISIITPSAETAQIAAYSAVGLLVLTIAFLATRNRTQTA